MGAALARLLVKQGYRLALLARRGDLLEALSSELAQADGERQVLAYPHDVREHQSVPELLRRIVADLGGLDLIVYVAGVTRPPGIDNYDFAGDREMLETNLLGAMAWLDPVAAMFQSAGAGQIVGVSSVAGDRGRVGNPGYNSSKAGLTTYLEALRNRLSRHGVHVLTVKPGFVKTEQLKAAARVFFPISPEKAAQDIWQAMRQRKQQIYTPGIWALIMLIVRSIPSFVFRRMSF
jgi:short-subunit dehydrogenase